MEDPEETVRDECPTVLAVPLEEALSEDETLSLLAEEDARAEQQQTRVVGLQQAVRALQQQRGGALGGGVAAGKATA